MRSIPPGRRKHRRPTAEERNEARRVERWGAFRVVVTDSLDGSLAVNTRVERRGAFRVVVTEEQYGKSAGGFLGG
ncbi:hypothetical protein BRC81_15015 [Halobacteriales archaeon QS_1_68_20]|nr:MAG: hypothetical protein BRC81_15015 [Halobacteriales archaeon QS_1_68_20]